MPSRPVLVSFLLCLVGLGLRYPAHAAEPWFEEVKKTATPTQLYRFLYAMPKGGDLHNHLPGCASGTAPPTDTTSSARTRRCCCSRTSRPAPMPSSMTAANPNSSACRT